MTTSKTSTPTNGSTVATPVAQPLPEAPVSITIRLMYRGRDTMLTLRGHDGAAALERMDAALNYLEANGATATTQNGAQVPADATTPICPTHGTPMTPSKFGGFYCTAKIADDNGAGKPVYCKQKAS